MSADTSQIDESMMRRALRLAMGGRGSVEPNPMVGCVIVQQGRVIGEGFHQRFGGPHAEREALAACREPAVGATVYVTLEPCCHVGKKTPPCVPALVDAKVGRVVVGCVDPNAAVSGRGVAQLRAAGIAVTAPLLEASARQLIAPYVKHLGGLPYVTLKWAQTADGRVAGPGGTRLQITGPRSTQLIHRLRACSDAIMIGIGTLLADDPLLTVRGVTQRRRLLRIVLDTYLRTPPEARLISVDPQDVLILCGRDAPADKRQSIERHGAKVIAIAADGSSRLSLHDALKRVADLGVTHLLVEPGPTLAGSLLSQGLADRLLVSRCPRVTAGNGPAAPRIPGGYIETRRLDVDGDLVSEHLNAAGPAYFAPDPSADMVLAGEWLSAASPIEAR
jgi:diaminohydroxyphosphoribosylaminopyrimidine deaminase/5-amino-6-(5-phosphoribosylamino)uracil reductase